MTVDPYTDPASGVLRNRFGIADAQRLRDVEADLTTAALADLGTRVLPGGYDLAHLRLFHAEIFGDLYPRAGEVRTVGIAKTDPFCLPHHIEAYSAEVFDWGRSASCGACPGATSSLDSRTTSPR